MSNIKSSLALVFGAVFLSACGDAPQTTQTQKSVEPASVSEPAEARPAKAAMGGDGTSKIVIYRTSYSGFAVQPKVFVDGRDVAVCAPGRATTVEVKPGTHRLTAKTLAEKAVSVSVPSGGTSYVRCSLTMGLVVGGVKLVNVPAAEAASKVAKLKQVSAN